jgi:sulfite exporter TauE/SafE
LLPCGLLYSALMLAALSDTALDGAAAMAAFAVASGAGLQVGTSQLRRLRERAGAWGVRVAGAALVTASAWGLGHGVWDTVAALCA